MNDSFPKLLETLAGGKGLALATIVETEGSTPQVSGASAIFSAAGLEAGTVEEGFSKRASDRSPSRPCGTEKRG